MFTQRDCEGTYREEDCVLIELRGDTAVAGDNSVIISGTTVTLTKEGVYLLSGTLTEGTLVIAVQDKEKVQLVLKDAHIQNSTDPCIYVESADKVFVTLAEGTENTLTGGESFSSGDAVLFSKADLTLNGAGSLTVTAPAGHAVTSKDDLVITGGKYALSSASHGLDANDSIRIKAGELTIHAGKDGIHAENTEDGTLGFFYASGGDLKIEAEGDGVSAGAYMQITGGSFDILAGGGSVNASKDHSDNWGGMGGPGRRDAQNTTTEDSASSMKGLKSGGDMILSGGNFTMDCADDAVHSNASMVVSSGEFTVATGDDGFHAEETLSITGGNIVVTESYEGLEAHHIQVQDGNIRLTCTDDGLNAAGGVDSSGTDGGRDGMYGRPGGGGPGGMGGNSDGSVVITGGTLYIKSSGDGIDANGTLTISGGHVTVVGPTQGDTATLDYDVSGVITGGTFIGTGSTFMAQSFSDSQQGVIALRVGTQPAGTQIILTDSEGNVLISCAPELDFAVVILSSPDIEKGKTYSLSVGTQNGSFEAS